MCFCFVLFAFDSSANSFLEVYEDAELARQKAAKLSFEWTTLSILLKNAKEAAASGDLARAEKLAGNALMQANSAIKQAEFAKLNWQRSVP